MGNILSMIMRVIELAVAGPPPKIFKLDIDCFNEIFEYLSMEDLHSVGRTCKTLQQVAGEYFKQNCAAAKNLCQDDGVYTRHSRNESLFDEYFPTSGFNEFMPYISLEYTYGIDTTSILQYIQSHIDEFKSTNNFCMVNLPIDQQIVMFIENLLPKIETIQIRKCWTSGNFYELILKYCKNLKRIYVQDVDFTSSDDKTEWLLQHYPMLEYLELLPIFDKFERIPPVIDELNRFFERHPKVQTFSTSTSILWANKNELLKSNAKLDVLELRDIFLDNLDDKTETIKSIWDLLNQLHKQGFYKRLFIYINAIVIGTISSGSSLRSVPGLELLCIRQVDQYFNLPFLTNLKELIILDGLTATDAKLLANDLVKLERLYVDETTIEEIQPFICHSKKLKKIKLNLKNIREDESSNWKVLNLIALNKEREKLMGARKITIYVREDVFLATKWATKNGDINLSLIEMKRSDSFEWNLHDFCTNQYFPED